MVSRTEFGDLPDYTFRHLAVREQRDNAFGLDQPDVLLQPPTQARKMQLRIGAHDWDLGDPDVIPFDAHFKDRGFICPHVESAPAAQVEAGVVPVAGKQAMVQAPFA